MTVWLFMLLLILFAANVIVTASGQRCSCLWPTVTTDRETSLPFSRDISPRRDRRLGWGHTVWPPRSVSPPPRLRSFFLAAHVTPPLGKPENPCRLHRSIRLVKGSTASTAATHDTMFHSRVTGHLLVPGTSQSGRWSFKFGHMFRGATQQTLVGTFTYYYLSTVSNQSAHPDLWPPSTRYFPPQNCRSLVLFCFWDHFL